LSQAKELARSSLQPVSTSQQTYDMGNGFYAYIQDDTISFSEYPPLSLQDLVAQHPSIPYIVEDSRTRLAWMKALQAANSKFQLRNGSYFFCFRDYVNHEEWLFMLARRWSIDVMLMKTVAPGQLVVQDEKCLLRERGVLLGFVPIKIEWQGRIKENRIVWETTWVRIGYEWFGKTIDKPQVSERMRVHNWLISGLDDIVVLHRLGQGRLVYAPVRHDKQEKAD
jgi:hypothetical protein